MITIPCYGHTKESLESIDNAAKMAELGIEVQPDEEYILKPVHFFRIDYVHEGVDGETVIGSGDIGFYTNLSIKEVLDLINESSIH